MEIPHPRLAERAFALAPLSEIAPRAAVPGCGQTVEQLLDLQLAKGNPSAAASGQVRDPLEAGAEGSGSGAEATGADGASEAVFRVVSYAWRAWPACSPHCPE